MVALETRTFVHRILRRMARFTTFDEATPPVEYAAIAARYNDRALGLYVNPPASSPAAVLVTSCSLILLGAKDAVRVAFADIRDVTWHPEEKREASSVQVTLKNEQVVCVPIGGRSANAADVFEFVRFVGRATAVARA